MVATSAIGPITKAKPFTEWSEAERRGYLVFCACRDFWKKRQGYYGEFRGLSPDQIRQQPQFRGYVETAAWLEARDKKPSVKSAGWKQYIEFVCEHFAKKKYRLTPAHLRSDILLVRYNQGCGYQKEYSRPSSRVDLQRRYHRALHPSLRNTPCLKALGFDLL